MTYYICEYNEQITLDIAIDQKLFSSTILSLEGVRSRLINKVMFKMILKVLNITEDNFNPQFYGARSYIIK